MLKISNLHVKLEEEDKVILRGVDLTVKAGEVHAIMGRTGLASRRCPMCWPGARAMR